MFKLFRYSLICLICVSAFLAGRPAYAQIRYQEVTFKDSLIQMLFQYGREVYLRGVDLQEAAFVFQRILVLDCRHDGAQEFLEKIRNKYPNVSIKVFGCSEEEQADELADSVGLEIPEVVKPNSLRKERRLAAGQAVDSAAPDAIAEVSFTAKPKDIRATPLRAFSEPLGIDSLTPQDQLEIVESVDNFPIIDHSFATDPLSGPKDEITGISEDCEQLRTMNTQLANEITQLKDQIQVKDDAIVRYQKEIASIHGDSTDASYALISQDQKDLIRVQQENIDFLEKELAEARAQVSASRSDENPDFKKMRREIASAVLTAKENEMNLEARNREAQLLQRQLSEQQEQLRLVKQILSEKNDIIKSLQDELEALRLESD